MEWEYPVYVEPVKEAKAGSVAKRVRRALSREDAIKYIAGDDPRPLLVLRECKVCNGTDDALLKGGTDNEKTFLLARWFHCVKLPADVMEENHLDGSKHDPLESQTSRTELWDSMSGLLSEEYNSKPDSALKSATKLLGKMDLADTRLDRLEERRDEILEEDGPDSRKLPKLAKKIDAAKKECERLHADMRKASKLALRPRTEAPVKAGM